MSDDDIKKLEATLSTFNKAARLVRFIVWIIGAVASIVIGVAVWVWSTNSAIATTQTVLSSTRADIHQMQLDRVSALKDWTDWRTSHEKNEARIITLQENMQKMLEHHEVQIDYLNRTQKASAK